MMFRCLGLTGRWTSAFPSHGTMDSLRKSIQILKCGVGQKYLENLIQTDVRQLTAPVKSVGRKCTTLEGHSQTCNFAIIELPDRKEQVNHTYCL